MHCKGHSDKQQDVIIQTFRTSCAWTVHASALFHWQNSYTYWQAKQNYNIDMKIHFMPSPMGILVTVNHLVLRAQVIDESSNRDIKLPSTAFYSQKSYFMSLPSTFIVVIRSAPVRRQNLDIRFCRVSKVKQHHVVEWLPALLQPAASLIKLST